MLCGLAPQIVNHDIDFGGCFTKRSRRFIGIVSEMDDVIGADGRKCVEPNEVAPGADHSPGAEPFCDLYGHGPGITSCAQDEHALAGLDRDSPAQRHP